MLRVVLVDDEPSALKNMEHILTELPDVLITGMYTVKVVFVTAYNKYAKAVSEAGAVDYLLKPVRKEQLEKTLVRLEKRSDGSH